MEEMSMDYWNKLADQIIVISSLLSGFSIAVIANLLVSEANTRFTRTILVSAVLAASFFLVSVFAMTKVLLMTTAGFPLAVAEKDLNIFSWISGLALILGISSLLTMIALSGWTKSKRMGIFTTIVGIITLVLILILLI